MDDEKVETSETLQKLFYDYTHLLIGGKEIVCPYWINNLKLGIFGPYGGKGTPKQVVEAVETEAGKEGLNLKKMTPEEILNFMKQKKIGVDCSGFVFWMLNALDREKGGDGIANNIPGCKGKILECRVNVKMLTGEDVSLPIKKIENIRVGDMIRLCRGEHVAVVMGVTREVGNLKRIKEIEYSHSSSRTKTQGVHLAKIKIISQESGLETQLWEEETKEGRNYGKTNYFPQIGDSIRRLEIWA